MWTSRLLATALCALPAGPRLAVAANSGRAAVEKALGQEAEAEYAAGRFKQAALLFHRAFAQRQDVGYLYSAGRAEQQAGQVDEALATYATVLRLAPAGSEFARKARLYLDAIKAQRAAQPAAQPPAPGPLAAAPPPVPAPAPVPATPTVAPAVPPTPGTAAPAPLTSVAATPSPPTPPELADDAPRAGWWLLAGGTALAIGGAGIAWSSWRDVRRLDEAVGAASSAVKAQAVEDYKAAAQQSKGPIVGGWIAAGVGVAAAIYGVWSLPSGAAAPVVAVMPGPGAGVVVSAQF